LGEWIFGRRHARAAGGKPRLLHVVPLTFAS
jgi:hypothetical protein